MWFFNENRVWFLKWLLKTESLLFANSVFIVAKKLSSLTFKFSLLKSSGLEYDSGLWSVTVLTCTALNIPQGTRIGYLQFQLKVCTGLIHVRYEIYFDNPPSYRIHQWLHFFSMKQIGLNNRSDGCNQGVGRSKLWPEVDPLFCWNLRFRQATVKTVFASIFPVYHFSLDLKG